MSDKLNLGELGEKLSVEGYRLQESDVLVGFAGPGIVLGLQMGKEMLVTVIDPTLAMKMGLDLYKSAITHEIVLGNKGPEAFGYRMVSAEEEKKGTP
jgi:hypothetical protein